MAKKSIKKNDEVLVIAGSHKGAKGKVIKVSKDKQRVTIDKVNISKKHVKPTQQNPDGGIQEFESPIHISNVKLVAKGKEAKAEKKAKKEAAKEAKVEAKETKSEKTAAPKKVVKEKKEVKEEKANKPQKTSEPKDDSSKPAQTKEVKEEEK